MADVAGAWLSTVTSGTVDLDLGGVLPVIGPGGTYHHRARNAANSAFVYWSAAAPDPDGAFAPEAILAGSAVIIGAPS